MDSWRIMSPESRPGVTLMIVTGLRLAVEDGAGTERRTAILGQERGMDVDRAASGNRHHFLRENLAVGRDDEEIKRTRGAGRVLPGC